MRVGVSYDFDQYERLEGKQPALMSIFKLKAIANKMRHHCQGYEFKRGRPAQDLVSEQDAQAMTAHLTEKSEAGPRQSLPEGHAVSMEFSHHTNSVVVHGPSNFLGLYTIFVHPLCLFLFCVPLGFMSSWLNWGTSWTFWLNFLALVPLAKILGDATEELAASLQNDTISGLLNATFGNAVEMILSVQALRKNLFSVVKLSLLGSVLSNILLVLGSAFLLGGLTPSTTRRGRFHSFQGNSGEDFIGMEKEQKFALKSALISMAMLLFSCMSFALPTMFDSFTKDPVKVLIVSRIGAWISMSSYVAFLIFQLLTHTKTLSQEEHVLSAPPGVMQANSDGAMLLTEDIEAEEENDEAASISATCAVLLMLCCTVVTAVNSELLVGVINDVVQNAGIPETFIGVILLPIAGNACEHAGAIRFAMNDRPGLAIGIAVGSSTQVALLVVPFAVIMGSFMGKPLDLDFGALNTAVVTLSVLVVLTLLLDGRSNWMKGYLLVALYVFIAILYWFMPTNLI